jgi:hypothetical protein
LTWRLSRLGAVRLGFDVDLAKGDDSLRHCVERETDLRAASDATGLEVLPRVDYCAAELVFLLDAA